MCVNDLPLSMVLSWYEQKAGYILMKLLYLGGKNICLGPSLPVIISQNVLNHLVDHDNMPHITTTSENMTAIL